MLIFRVSLIKAIQKIINPFVAGIFMLQRGFYIYNCLAPRYLDFQYELFMSEISTPRDDPACMNFPFTTKIPMWEGPGLYVS